MTTGRDPVELQVPRTVLIAAALISVLQCALFAGVRRDDAFISFRYAQNLSRGAGLVFNPGEYVMGSTSPGHVLLAAVVHRLVGDQLLPSLMSALGCVGWTAQALAIGLTMRRALPARAAWAIALAVALGAGRAQEQVSLETTIVAGLASWAVVMALAERWYVCSALAALSVLFRPDMYLLVGLLALLCCWYARRAAFGPALVFAGLTAPWYLFAYAYYGTVLPQSAATKFHRRELGEYALFELRESGAMGLPFEHPIVVDVLACALSAYGAYVLIKRVPRAWVLPVWLVLHNVAYLWLRPFAHSWHMYPVASLSAVLLMVGIFGALGGLAANDRARAWLATAPIALLTVAYALTALDFACSYGLGLAHGARDQVHRAVAGFLRAHARPRDLVASVEVGTVAYYSNLTMYDWGNLVTPKAVFRPTDRRLNWAMVDRTTPELGVSQTPVEQFAAGDFSVKLYNFELLELAAVRVARAAGPSFRPRQLKSELRPNYEREVLLLSKRLEHSDQRIDAFLAQNARAPCAGDSGDATASSVTQPK